MSEPPSDSIELGSTEIPEVLHTLIGVLPQFEGLDLENQLQTYDTFLDILAPSVRLQISALLAGAACRTQNPTARARIEAAATSVANGGRAAAPYNHEQAMADYQKSFRQSFPNAPEPAPPSDPRGETDPIAQRTHPQILAQLARIEAEMKRINYWSANPPDLQAEVAAGKIKSYLDAPTFELWLQCLFIPRARQAATENKLPSGSSVGEMARRQYDYMSIDPNAETLLHLLQEFDKLVIQAQ